MSLGDRFVRLHGGHGICYDHTAKSWRHYSSGSGNAAPRAAAAVRARRRAGRRAGPAGPDARGASQAVLADARAALDRATSRAGSEAMLAPGPGAPIDREGRQRLRPGPLDPGHTEWVGGPEDRCPAAARPGPHDQPMQSCAIRTRRTEAPLRALPVAGQPRGSGVGLRHAEVGRLLPHRQRARGGRGLLVRQRGERQERAGQPASSDDGEYADSVSMSFLVRRDNNAGGPAPDLAKLAGLRLAQANEVESGSRLSSQTLKVAVSTEAISARAPVREPDHVPPDRQADHPRQPQAACRRHRRGGSGGACTWSPSTCGWTRSRVTRPSRPRWPRSSKGSWRGPSRAPSSGTPRACAPAPGCVQRLRSTGESPDRVGCWLSDRCSVGADPATGEGRPRGLLRLHDLVQGGGVLPWSKNALTRALEERGIERRRGRRPASEGGGLRYFCRPDATERLPLQGGQDATGTRVSRSAALAASTSKAPRAGSGPPARASKGDVRRCPPACVGHRR